MRCTGGSRRPQRAVAPGTSFSSPLSRILPACGCVPAGFTQRRKVPCRNRSSRDADHVARFRRDALEHLVATVARLCRSWTSSLVTCVFSANQSLSKRP